MRAELRCAGCVGLNFKVDCLVNRRGQIYEPVRRTLPGYPYCGAGEGKEHYAISHATRYDLAVCNAYAKANESAIALFLLDAAETP